MGSPHPTSTDRNWLDFENRFNHNFSHVALLLLLNRSMNNNNLSLQSNKVDYATLAIKSALVNFPLVGSLLVELAGTVIPNQRVDRIAKFVQYLEHRLLNLEQEFIQAQIHNEDFADLLEEGLRQATHSLTDERRKYIANIIASSLSSEVVNYIESKYLLRILNEINDIEVIWLRSFCIDTAILKSDPDFRKRHKSLLQEVVVYMGAPCEVFDKQALQKSYKEHLTQLGLLKHRYKVDLKTKIPEYDSFTGAQEVNGYEITSLGALLLRQISFAL